MKNLHLPLIILSLFFWIPLCGQKKTAKPLYGKTREVTAETHGFKGPQIDDEYKEPTLPNDALPKDDMYSRTQINKQRVFNMVPKN